MPEGPTPRWRAGLLLACSLLLSGPRGGFQGDEPRRVGAVDRTRVTIVLLDVEVRDREGRPVRGLRPEDFRLTLDHRPWPIASVDDLCAGEPPGTPGTAPTPEGAAAPFNDAASGAPAAGMDAPPLLYVVYLDFSQLQLAGRKQALSAVRTWLRTARRPGDEVMIVAYSTVTGLRELSPPSHDGTALQEAIESAINDMQLVDPFPEQFTNRLMECQQCYSTCMAERSCSECAYCCPCYSNALDEHEHQRRSLKALKLFLARMDRVPGRKAVLFFHENGVLEPGSFYPLEDSELTVGTLNRLQEEVGAEATTARAAIYPVQMGDSQLFNPLSKAAVNFGANLADFTGGSYNRGPSDRDQLLAEAARGAGCLYRIGFEPPETRRTRVYQARVKAAGFAVDHAYRVQFLTEEDRLTRQARAVLAGAPADDLPLRVLLTPASAGRRQWSVHVRLVLDLDALPVWTSAEPQQVDVGALLHARDASRSWEMLTGSAVRRHERAPTGTLLLYETILPGLDPGPYAIAAFVREQQADLFGSARAMLDLPPPGRQSIVGPWATRTRRVVPSPLPLRGEAPAPEGGASRAREGRVPADTERVVRGERLEMVTWVCPGEKRTVDASGIVRFVSRGGVPAFRLPEPLLEEAGVCLRLTDAFETGDLDPGTYLYHIEMADVHAPSGLASESRFTVVESGSGSHR